MGVHVAANRVNLGVRVLPEVRARLYNAARAEGIPIFEWVQRAIDERTDAAVPPPIEEPTEHKARVNMSLRIDPIVRQDLVNFADADGVPVWAWLQQAIRDSADLHDPQEALIAD